MIDELPDHEQQAGHLFFSSPDHVQEPEEGEAARQGRGVWLAGIGGVRQAGVGGDAEVSMFSHCHSFGLGFVSR